MSSLLSPLLISRPGALEAAPAVPELSPPPALREALRPVLRPAPRDAEGAMKMTPGQWESWTFPDDVEAAVRQLRSLLLEWPGAKVVLETTAAPVSAARADPRARPTRRSSRSRSTGGTCGSRLSRRS